MHCAPVSKTDNSQATSPLHPVLDHEDAHAGPYGVETPPCWSYVVIFTEVHAEVKLDSLIHGRETKLQETERVSKRSSAGDNERK